VPGHQKNRTVIVSGAHRKANNQTQYSEWKWHVKRDNKEWSQRKVFAGWSTQLCREWWSTQLCGEWWFTTSFTHWDAPVWWRSCNRGKL